MFRIDIDAEISDNIGHKSKRGIQRYLLDGAQRGQNVAMEHVPEDRSNLRMSMAQFVPEIVDDAVIWGVGDQPHARPQEFGTDPFWPPIQPLIEWAQRIGKDESFGYYVQWKIAQDGITAQPYLRPGAEAQKEWYKSHSAEEYIDNELDG